MAAALLTPGVALDVEVAVEREQEDAEAAVRVSLLPAGVDVVASVVAVAPILLAGAAVEVPLLAAGVDVVASGVAVVLLTAVAVGLCSGGGVDDTAVMVTSVTTAALAGASSAAVALAALPFAIAVAVEAGGLWEGGRGGRGGDSDERRAFFLTGYFSSAAGTTVSP